MQAERPHSNWIPRLLALWVVLLFLGWGLVLVSGYGGDTSGGSELLWRVGGLMVYASVPTLLIAGVLALLQILRSACRRFRRA